MTSLVTRVEIIKLAAVLDVDPAELDHLSRLAPQEVHAVRSALDEAIFARHEQRFRRIAKLAASVPAPLAARVAHLALDPLLGARVAAAMEPATAVKLAACLDTSYLSDLSIRMDPQRSRGILAEIPERTVLDVGAELVGRGEHLALGRFVSVIDPDTAVRVVRHATGSDLLHIALFADDAEALDALVARLGDDRLLGAIVAAHETGLYDDAVTLVGSVSRTSRDRLVPLIAALEPAGRDGFARSLHAHDVWEAVLPSLADLEDEVLAAIANCPATLDPGVLVRVVEIARDLDREDLLARFPQVLDAEHREVMERALT